MNRLTPVVGTIILLAGLALAQPYNAATMSPYRAMPAPVTATPGNILYPGGVTAPLHPTYLGATIGGPFHPSRLGGTIGGGAPYRGGRGGFHGGRQQTVVVPYAVPVYGGGYFGDGGYGMPQAQPNVTVVMPQQPAPSVIINQYSGTDSPRTVTTAENGERSELKVYEATPRRTETPSAPDSARSYVLDDKPNIYMIVLRDDTVRRAIGYWTEGRLLKYVTPEATISSVPLDTIDREASARVNAQNKLELDLPPAIQ
jgi:hypothetical protein